MKNKNDFPMKEKNIVYFDNAAENIRIYPDPSINIDLINNEIIIADFFFISYSFIIFNSEKAFIKLFSISSNSLSKILLFNIIIQLKPFW